MATAVGNDRKLDQTGQVVISSRTGKPKRRKAQRACSNCQRTHLTCDDGRPCERCKQRGLADSCRDSVRKQAKYLAEDPLPTHGLQDQDQVLHTPHHTPAIGPVAAAGEAPPIPGQIPISTQHPQIQSAMNIPIIHGYSGIPNQMATGHPAIQPTMHNGIHNGVYHGLHNPIPNGIQNGLPSGMPTELPNRLHSGLQTGMLAGVQPDPQNAVHSAVQSAVQSTVQTSPQNGIQSGLSGSVDGSFNTSGDNGTNGLETISPKDPDSRTAADVEYSVISRMIRQDSDRDMHSGSTSVSSASPPFDEGPVDLANLFSLQEEYLMNEENDPMFRWSEKPRRPPAVVVNKPQPSLPISSNTPQNQGHGSEGGVYRTVTAPYPYAPGFHKLLLYIKNRFGRQDLMRVVRSLAKIRPSFIACADSLTQDDLVFMEKCFQRTLLEHEKYFSYTATPTVVWRRTGQIAAVAPEFCTLTGWTKDALANQFIVHVMDDASAVAYFELFSEISFGDTRGALFTDCTLVTPQSHVVRTSAILTVRRDLFGIPMMLIGNFLPVLSS